MEFVVAGILGVVELILGVVEFVVAGILGVVESVIVESYDSQIPRCLNLMCFLMVSVKYGLTYFFSHILHRIYESLIDSKCSNAKSCFNFLYHIKSVYLKKKQIT